MVRNVEVAIIGGGPAGLAAALAAHKAGAKDVLEQDLHKVCWYTMFLYLTNGGTVEALGKTYEYMKERFAK